MSNPLTAVLRCCSAIALLYLLGFTAPLQLIAHAQARADAKLLTGEAFEQQLETKVGVAWAEEPLRTKLEQLTENLHVAIWLDRRIDPSQEPELSVKDMPLRSFFEFLATRLNAGVSIVDSVIYLGPKDTASELATVAALRNDEVARLPSAIRSRLTRPREWEWEVLTTPQELLQRLAEEAGVQLQGTEQLPHDLWAAGRLPAGTFADRLTLLLAGFDLTFEFDEAGRTVTLVPMPAAPRLTRSYTPRGDLTKLVSQLEKVLVDAQLDREGNRLTVTGRAEDHRIVERLLRGERVRKSTVAQARTVYSMRGPSTLGTALRTLEVQASLTVSLDAAAQAKLRDRVTFEVKDASLEELVTAVLKGTGLQFELVGKELKVFAAR